VSLSKKPIPRFIKNFLWAYCEDVLSADQGQEDNQDRAPACEVLRRTFLIDLTFLRTIKYLSYFRKASGDIPRNPNEILNSALEEHNIAQEDLFTLCQATEEMLGRRPLDPLIAAWDRRVFIGGPFNNMARLRDIQEVIIRLNYAPVFTQEVVGANQMVHHHNLMLLHTCRYAIFEITGYRGQLMEIERTRDYEIEPLLLYSSEDFEVQNVPEYVSAMLRTYPGAIIRNYRDTPQLVVYFFPLISHQVSA
jgi:hypothetical protein